MSNFPISEIVKLDFPLQLADRVVEELTLRRPTMKMLRKHPVNGVKDVTGEMRLIGALCGLCLEEIEEMDSGDYLHMQGILSRFQQRPSDIRGDSGDDAGTMPDDTLES